MFPKNAYARKTWDWPKHWWGSSHGIKHIFASLQDRESFQFFKCIECMEHQKQIIAGVLEQNCFGLAFFETYYSQKTRLKTVWWTLSKGHSTFPNVAVYELNPNFTLAMKNKSIQNFPCFQWVSVWNHHTSTCMEGNQFPLVETKTSRYGTWWEKTINLIESPYVWRQSKRDYYDIMDRICINSS